MASLNLMIDDKLDEQFRKEVVKRIGMKRGNIKKAVEEAIHNWTNQNGWVLNIDDETRKKVLKYRGDYNLKTNNEAVVELIEKALKKV